MTTHTILLLQPGPSKSSRTFSDHETVSGALEELIRTFEIKLKDLNPHVRNLSYDVNDLNKYIDHLPDAVALVLDNKLQAYIPHDKKWLKEKIYTHLQKIAGSGR